MLETRLKERARALGFDLVGIAPATPADHFDRFSAWLDRGYAGAMEYLHRHEEARRHPSSVLADVRSVVMVGINYDESGIRPAEGEKEVFPSTIPHAGKVARYARGPDYHHVIWAKLDRLLEWVQTEVPGCRGRGVTDTAPLLERDFARRAGLGWIGKNTLLINKQRGSFLLLGALLLNLELEPDQPHRADHCGTCTACLDACPTEAFVGPGWLDARRCISYLTIELRGPVPDELRTGVGDWLFGCDVCQEVCPWNGKALAAAPVAEEFGTFDAVELLALSDEEFRRRFRGTAFMRTKRQGVLRNAAIVLGNAGAEAALPALLQAQGDADPVVAEAARWAIGRIRERRGPRSDAISTHFPVANAAPTL